MKPNWFYSSEFLLELYVRLLAQERQLATAIEPEKVGCPRYIQLVRLHRGVIMAAANLAGKLRLTPRSSIDRTVVKTTPSGPKPWEFAG